MSTISSITSTTNPYPSTNQSGFGQFVQSFNALGSALQSGDLSNAQSALATFQQTLQGNSQTNNNQPFGKNSQANTDYQNLTKALQSGNLTDAQKDFTSLQNDLKSARGVHKGHHHHHSSSATASTTTPTNTPTNNVTSGSATDSDGDNDGSGLNVTA